MRVESHFSYDVIVQHDGVIKCKHFPCYWPFVKGIHRSPVNSPHKGQWHEALTFSLICARINGWVNNREAGDLRRHRAHYDVIVMTKWAQIMTSCRCMKHWCQSNGVSWSQWLSQGINLLCQYLVKIRGTNNNDLAGAHARVQQPTFGSRKAIWEAL